MSNKYTKLLQCISIFRLFLIIVELAICMNDFAGFSHQPGNWQRDGAELNAEWQQLRCRCRCELFLANPKFSVSVVAYPPGRLISCERHFRGIFTTSCSSRQRY